MDRSYIPLTKFYEKCLPAAKDNGYKYVMCLLARDVGIDGLYRLLEQQWYALDDITGKDFLFMFTGKYNEDDYHSEVNCDYFVLRNEYAHIMNRDPSLKLKTTYDFREREERGKFSPDLPINHTRVVSALRKTFGLSENEIPCLVYTNLHNGKNIVVPFDGDRINLYDYFRHLYIAIENNLLEINEIIMRILRCNKIAAKLPPTIISLREELYKIADTLAREEKDYLLDCINSLSQATTEEERRRKLSGSIRVKLGQYIDSMKKTFYDSDLVSQILQKTEPQNSQSKLDALYDKVDETIRLSPSFDSQSFKSDPHIALHQNGGIQIGMVSNGGAVNILDTQWKTIISQRMFNLLEDFYKCIPSSSLIREGRIAAHVVINKAQELLDFYSRHTKQLEIMSNQIISFEALFPKYKAANRLLRSIDDKTYSGDDVKSKKDTAFSDLVQHTNDLKELTSIMLKQLCEA